MVEVNNEELKKKCLLTPIEFTTHGVNEEWLKDIFTAQLTKAIPIIAKEYETKGYAKGCEVTTRMFSEAKTQALKAQADSIKRELEKAIADEPEFPSKMPDEMYEAINEAVKDRGDRSTIIDIMRNVVRITKEGITERFLDAFANLTGESGD